MTNNTHSGAEMHRESTYPIFDVGSYVGWGCIL